MDAGGEFPAVYIDSLIPVGGRFHGVLISRFKTAVPVSVYFKYADNFHFRRRQMRKEHPMPEIHRKQLEIQAFFCSEVKPLRRI